MFFLPLLIYGIQLIAGIVVGLLGTLILKNKGFRLWINVLISITGAYGIGYLAIILKIDYSILSFYIMPIIGATTLLTLVVLVKKVII